ncbi:hypothetical protein [Maridesulfovibrio bastinii]|uniref:hypothetical protein n=1 Tax=Maridesulfovibrio bastinii TaxID=47157 RepID=UPI0003FA1469|nr:hypothetical protein [Maridesulfovibrio bastinii]
MLSPKNKICFIGNCQALNLKEIANEAGLEAKYFLSILSELNHVGGLQEAKSYLKHYLPEEEISGLLSTGSIKINPSAKDFHKFKPDTIVCNLFHESELCYQHKKSGFIIEVNEQYWPENLGVDFWSRLQTDFDQIIPDSSSYLARFKNFIFSLTESFPDAQIIIIERIKNFSDSDKSTLKNWNMIQAGADQFYSDIEKIKNIKVIKISQPLEDYIYESGFKYSFPVLFDSFQKNDRYIFTKHYDLEHPGKHYWQLVFKKLYPKYSLEFSRSQNIDITINNLLSDAIETGDNNLFAELLRKNKKIEIPVETLHAGAFLFDNDFFHHIRDYLEHKMSHAHPLYRAKALRLMRICSNQKIFQNIPENSKIALWGAGGRCRTSIKILKNKFNIQYIFDSDPEKHGKKISEIPIIFYKNLPENLEIDAIVITTVFFRQVTDAILKNAKLKHLKILNSNELLDKALYLNNSSILKIVDG